MKNSESEEDKRSLTEVLFIITFKPQILSEKRNFSKVLIESIYESLVSRNLIKAYQIGEKDQKFNGIVYIHAYSNNQELVDKILVLYSVFHYFKWKISYDIPYYIPLNLKNKLSLWQKIINFFCKFFRLNSIFT